MKRILLVTIIIAASSLAAAGGPGLTSQRPPLPLNGLFQSTLPIVFTSNRDGNSEIYRMNSDGSGTVRLTYKVTAVDRDPRLSPDGSRIAFTSDREGNNEIYVMNADGSSPTRLTRNTADDHAPYWSPDGSRIMFARVLTRSFAPFYEFQILIMNADGTGERIITRSGRLPRWSPDGNYIAFADYPTGSGTPQIYLMKVDGSAITRLTVSGSADYFPDWSPDGMQIVFTRDSEIWIMNSDGSGQRSVGYGTHPAWARDGRGIAFVKGPDDATQIYVMNPDGSSPIRISGSAGWNYDPDW
jgi:Tol biopolymer transport system component